ncbi:DgyrCDS11182 [Dimorphilus gyrociliatus]|uniref:Dynein regulatory complex protein 12 n=1 Tax=Dimorphilus gyrociliatus TaxID=2664684 RepID=A0A7I8W3K0_9ANNE|nr:DgyrCDS11182 [Dimorphilus gyrociliatus]
MPPKKKGGKKKKKKTADGELTVEDKYKKTVEEIEALKDQLVVRREITRKSLNQNEFMRSKVKDVEERLEKTEIDQRMASQDMTRMYKTMHKEMSIQIDELGAELISKQAVLETTQQELEQVKKDKDEMERKKDDEIARLNRALENMDRQYRDILSDAFHSLKVRIDDANSQWKDKEIDMQSENKRMLMDLGLYPLKI